MIMRVLMLLGVLGCLSPLAHANLNNEQLNAAICILANQGIHTSAVERQAGTSKQAAKTKLDQELTQVRSQFKDARFVDNIGKVWYRALDTIYGMPIQPNQADKEAFISGITQEAFQSCIDSLGRMQR